MGIDCFDELVVGISVPNFDRVVCRARCQILAIGRIAYPVDKHSMAILFDLELYPASECIEDEDGVEEDSFAGKGNFFATWRVANGNYIVELLGIFVSSQLVAR